MINGLPFISLKALMPSVLMAGAAVGDEDIDVKALFIDPNVTAEPSHNVLVIYVLKEPKFSDCPTLFYFPYFISQNTDAIFNESILGLQGWCT
jgi:hypothetical protein